MTTLGHAFVLQDPGESDKTYLMPGEDDELIIDWSQSGEVQGTVRNSALTSALSVNYDNAKLSDIIKDISKKNKINFVYGDRLLNISGITMKAENQPLYKILDELFKGQSIGYYEYEPGAIVLASQDKIDESTGGIKGTVMLDNGEPAVGANVLLQGTHTGCSTDDKGNFLIKKLLPSRVALAISLMGYEKIVRTVLVQSGVMTDVNVILKITAFQIGGIEVLGTSELLPDDVGTKTKISGGEIEHYQASSLKDVLDLVPGVQKTENPGLSKTSQVALRGNENDNGSSFGTLVVVDGMPVSNNANLQFVRPVGATFGTSNIGGSVDLRTIPADNIENLEVITGLPSVKYGDVTSGVINMKTKAGVAPNRIKLKNNPDTREGNAEGGVALGAGAFSYNLNAAQSERDVRVTGDEYLRLSAQGVVSQKMFDNALQSNYKFSWQRIMDDQEPHGDLHQTKNFNHSYSASLSSWGTWNYIEGVSSLEYNVYTTVRRENSMKSKLVTDYVILPGGDTISSYIGKMENKGLEWNAGGRIEYNNIFYTGDLIHKVLFGIEPQYNANTGEGLVFDTLLSYYGQGSGNRPYSFEKIPGQLLLGLYSEDKITGHLVYDYNVMLGFRYEMYNPFSFNPSGILGNGDLVRSHQGTFFNPRLNLMIYFSKNQQLRLSAGTSSKSPPMSVLYPPEDVFAWRNPVDGKNYFFRQDLWQSELKGYCESMAEISFDQQLFNKFGMSLSGYYKVRNGYPTSSSIPYFSEVLSDNSYKAYFIGEYSRLGNTGKTETKGVEFSLKSSRIEPLNMVFTVNGSYLFVKNIGTGNYYSNTNDVSKGQFSNYSVHTSLVDTMIGWMYPRRDKWNDRFQLNYSLRYTLRSLGLWVTVRAEQVVFERTQTLDQAPIDLALVNQTETANYNFARELKTKQAKWLFNFNMSKSLFPGAEISFYVNNFMNDYAIRRYYISLTQESDEKRNPDLFYGIEMSMIIDRIIE